MSKLIYSMITSLDGYATGPEGDDTNWGVAEDDEVHAFMGEYYKPVRTYLYGRRMYETMVYWETAHLEPDVQPVHLDYARVWQAADKIVYSTTLEQVSSARTRIERTFDPETVRKLKAESEGDLTVDGPMLAAQAIRAGLVDEIHLAVGQAIVGGGKPFFPRDVRVNVELLDLKRFDGGTVFLRYGVKGNA
jgi:dihydrofolate reductase